MTLFSVKTSDGETVNTLAHEPWAAALCVAHAVSMGSLRRREVSGIAGLPVVVDVAAMLPSERGPLVAHPCGRYLVGRARQRPSRLWIEEVTP